METSYTIHEVNEARNNIMMYIINNSVNKLPLKVSDIVEKVLSKNAKRFKYCFPLAKEALKNNYGIMIADLPDTKGGRKFICYSGVTAKSPIEYDQEQQRQITLLFIVISYIFMNDSEVYESQLERFLNGLKIYFDSEHEYFGPNVKKLITETFVKQLYLKRSKSESELDTEVRYLYGLGFRSIVEFRKKDILREVSEILGKPASYFVVQYQQAQAEQSDNENEIENDVVPVELN